MKNLSNIMKNKLLWALILIFILLIIVVSIYFKAITNNNTIINETNNNSIYTITFKSVNYSSINNIIFYDSELDLSEETKRIFLLISNEFANKYPNKQLLYLPGETPTAINMPVVFRFIQISNNIIIDDTRVEIDYFRKTEKVTDIRVTNLKDILDTKIKIDIDTIKDIAQKHIEQKYNISKNLTCEMELRYYKSKICWKISFFFMPDNYEVYIDANSGNIIESKNYTTVFVD